jgi:hypothetical protein
LFFFEKKNQKTFILFTLLLSPPGYHRACEHETKVFCFFFSKKKAFFLSPLLRCHPAQGPVKSPRRAPGLLYISLTSCYLQTFAQAGGTGGIFCEEAASKSASIDRQMPALWRQGRHR